MWCCVVRCIAKNHISKFSENRSIDCNTCKCIRIIIKSIRYLRALHIWCINIFVMSNKRLRFDKKKSTRNKAIEWKWRKEKTHEATHCLSFCRHIFDISSAKGETRKQLNQTSLWTVFFFHSFSLDEPNENVLFSFTIENDVKRTQMQCKENLLGFCCL